MAFYVVLAGLVLSLSKFGVPDRISAAIQPPSVMICIHLKNLSASIPELVYLFIATIYLFHL